MSQLESFKGIKDWTLDTDKKFLDAISTSTDTTYNGMREMLESLRDLERKTEDCFIHLKHAVNWMNSLNYTKFIENHVQSVAKEAEPPVEVPAEVSATAPSPENNTEKYLKAIDIALTDLNLKDLKGGDDNAGQGDSATLDGITMAAAGNYVTAQLKGRIPFLIGSKEFGMAKYIGLEVGTSSSLTEDKLKDLKEEEKEERPGEKEESAQKAYKAMTEAAEEIKAAEPPKTAKQYDASNYLNSFASKSSNPFGLDERDDDEELPQFKSPKEEVLPAEPQVSAPPPVDAPAPPPIHVPEPPPPVEDEVQPPEVPAETTEEKKEASPIGAGSALFANPGEGEDFNSIQARTSEKPAPKADYKQRMNKLFGLGDDSDEEQENPKEISKSLIGIYQGQNSNLFGSPAPGSQPGELPAAKTSTQSADKQKTEVSKKLSMFLADDEDEDLAAANTKKTTGKNGLFSDN